jgi:hypothetical protein
MMSILSRISRIHQGPDFSSLRDRARVFCLNKVSQGLKRYLQCFTALTIRCCEGAALRIVGRRDMQL